MSLFYRISNHYQTDQVFFRRPTRLGTYAVKKDLNFKRTLVTNAEDFYLKYSLDEFRSKKSLDLKEGFEQRPPDFESNGKLDELLQWIILNKNLFLLKDEKTMNGKLRSLNTDFVSFRGTLTLLLNISFDFKTPFIIHAEKFIGTYYLMLEKPEQESIDPIFTFAGRRFEVYLSKDFSEDDKLKMNPNRINLCNKEKTDEFKSIDKNLVKNKSLSKFEKQITTDLCFVYRSRLNDYSLVYGAEMDVFENVVKLFEPIDSDLIRCVELKTCRKIQNQRQENSFRKFKMMKWFNQSFLAGVKKLSVGFWTNDHIVEEIEEYSLEDLIKLGIFDKELCLFQLNQILSFIKHCFTKKNTNLLKFTYIPFSYKIICEETDVKPVLPDFYKNSFAK